MRSTGVAGSAGRFVVAGPGAWHRVLLGVSLALVGFAVWVGVAVAARGDWPQYGHGPAHGANDPAESVLGPGNVGALVTAWSAEVGAVDQEPVVADGRVFVASEGYSLEALDEATGAVLWTAGLGAMAFSAPAVARGRVYVNAGGGLYAFAASTGRQLWVADKPDDVAFSSPVVAGGVVYVGQTGTLFSGHLLAFDADSGAPLWSFATRSEVGASPAVANGIVYLSTRDDGIYALDAATGAGRWHVGGGSFITPSVEHGRVFTGSAALDALTGASLWQVPAAGSSMAVANGVVYYSWVGSDSSERLVARRAASGKFLWHATFGSACCFIGPWTSSPAVANGVVYIGDRAGALDAFDANTGALLTSLPTLGATLASPVVSDGRVFLGASGGITAYTLPPTTRTPATSP